MECDANECSKDEPREVVTIKTEIMEMGQPAEYVDIEVTLHHCISASAPSFFNDVALPVKEEDLDYRLDTPVSDVENIQSDGPTGIENVNSGTDIPDQRYISNGEDALHATGLTYDTVFYKNTDTDYRSHQITLRQHGKEKGDTLAGTKNKHISIRKRRTSNMLVKIEALKGGRKGSHATPFACVKCKKLFKNKKTLTKHVKVVHSETLYTCAVCFKTFKRGLALTAHMKKTHRQFKCDFCNEIYKKKTLLNAHIKNHHEFQSQYTCDHCEETFKMKKSLRNHILNVHGSGCYRCTLCNKNFKCEQYLSRHIATVHTSLEHPCDVCGKVLKPKNLQVHMVNVHSEVRFKCELCGKMLKNKQYLRRHVTDLHGDQPPDSQSLHPCELCKKIFKNKVSLKRHTLCVHTTGSYGCDLCKKDFKSEIYLLKHKTTVHVTEEHKCELCKKIFRARHLLLKHTRRIHKKSLAECVQLK